VASLLLVVMGVAAVELLVERAHFVPRSSDDPPSDDGTESTALFTSCSLRAPRVE
jgi:hypothetical protein